MLTTNNLKICMMLVLLFLTSISTVLAQDWGETEKVVAVIGATSHRNADDRFSGEINALDIDGDRAVVGSEYENENKTNTSNVPNAGAAFVIEYDGNGDWTNDTKLVAGTSRDNGDRFGHSVAIAGNYIVVGAPFDDHTGASNGGSIYIYEYTTSWTEVGRFTASDVADDDNFGWSVEIHSDVIIVGSPNSDLNASGGGTPVSNAGAVYFFDLEGTELDKVIYTDRIADDHFGWDVDIHIGDNDFAIVGAPDEDEDASGSETKSGAGSAFILRTSGSVSNWVVNQKIVADDRGIDDRFGYSVAMDENYVIIGADQDEKDKTGSGSTSNAGSSYIFNYSTSWSQQAKLEGQDRDTDNRFGVSVGISGTYAIVGSFADELDASGGSSLSNSGSAEVFERSGTTWSSFEKLVASDRAANDEFGWSVAINGDYAAVGAQYEDHLPGGGTPVTNAGSVYFSALCEDPVITTNLPAIIYCRDNPETISITANGVNHKDVSYQWYNSGGDISGATNSSYDVTADDDYYCIVTQDEACSGTYDIQSNTVDVRSTPPTGGECSGGGGSRFGLVDNNAVKIFPNPANQTLSVYGENLQGVKIYDQIGRAIDANSSKSNELISINTSDLAQGVYILEISSNFGIERRKISIQH
ncbi:MAG: T9SS type A sorting domain-containing protein [Cytophagales bacterium]